MTIKKRKRVLDKLIKDAEDKALIEKVAQEAQATSSSPEEYAKNFLKKILEQTDVHIVGEDDIT